jgi:hypothetical protein
MHTDFVALIRAHALTLVRMARTQTDLEHALELEALAVALLKITHQYEVQLRKLRG